MIGIVVAAHGELADALVATAKSVLSESGPIVAVGISDTDDAATYETRLQQAIESVDGGGGVLVITDMFGGTPSNVGLTMHKTGHVEVLTGVNLPMIIKAIQLAVKETTLETASIQVKEYGRRAIAVASQVLGIAPDSASEESNP